uniref:Putative Response regulator receiver domain protein (CheY-like) n=1 Tax=Candidatus Nitrotoga fabula TaxID=2182327 RepID=A0A2X0QYG9_9PROT|nr:putative Response regulator receiver domain protein (CheY-like) [Candidatus Nitrotoga fabula]
MDAVPTVLIVEDNESKLNSIQGVLERELRTVDIRKAHSVRSAIDDVLACMPDLIIADMSLPTYDIKIRERGGSPRPFGGIEVFDTLERYEIVVPVLVVTSYPTITEGGQSIGLTELSKRLHSDFSECFIGTVYFDSAYSNWENEMMVFVHQVLKAKYGT